MTIFVIIGDEKKLNGDVNLIRDCTRGELVVPFRSSEAVMAYQEEQTADVAFIDIESLGEAGMDLALRMKKKNSRLNFILIISEDEHIEDTIGLRASGYLIRPLRPEKIREELANLRYPEENKQGKLFIRTFDNFEVFFCGKPVAFRLQKTKEMLAYLVDRRGAFVSKDEMVTILWGGSEDKTSYLKQLQRDLLQTVKLLGVENVLIRTRGAMGVIPDRLNCDYYNWLRGNGKGHNAFMGEYMHQYSWAEGTLANILHRRSRVS